ncbi:MAG: DegQ family serine endoprotease [Gammaproteobacteria bacterium]|nr:DegQ family serine endoprotease [Gammaproteobacteria bacterium]
MFPWILKNRIIFVLSLLGISVVPLLVYALSTSEKIEKPAKLVKEISTLEDVKQVLKNLEATIAELKQEKLPDFSLLVKQNGEAVVNISTVQEAEKKSLQPEDLKDLPFQEFFKRFFGEEFGGDFGPEREHRSLGSGFIIEKEGYVLTNAHVVRNAKEIIVKLVDHRELPAKLVGKDEESDIAVLKIEGQNLPVVQIGSTEKLSVGNWVLAIGSPFGFERSATAGIVSAKGRSLRTERYVPFIQTDVAINPGNSGGPLFNLQGEVVGVNAQILSRTGGYMGVSFAIPIDIAMEVVKQLKESGRVLRGWLGVAFQEMTTDLAKSFGLKEVQGALVASVVEGSPADKAGLKIGDVIVRYDTHIILDASDLPHLVGPTKPGTKIEIEVIREGKKKVFGVAIVELPPEYASSMREKGKEEVFPKHNRLGVQTQDLTGKERASAKILEGGVSVQGVLPNSPAANAELKKGDIILEFNRAIVKNSEHLNQLVKAAPADKPLALLIKRGEGQLYLVVKFSEDKKE